MIIEPRIRNNICTTAHPLGCAEQVRSQIRYVKAREAVAGPKRVLVVGSSNGYGLAARIVSAFASGAATIGVAYERQSSGNRLGSAGWYNNEAFRTEADGAGLPAFNINGDAFSEEIKSQTVDIVRSRIGTLDGLIYSIAAPRRIDPQTGRIHSSVIKPVGAPFTSLTVDFLNGDIRTVTTQPATEEEVGHTVKVMGGEDWLLWVDRLQEAGLLSHGFTTVAFSYIGPAFTRAIYRDGTIGAAKRDLEDKAGIINDALQPLDGRAWISVNKALVTRASAMIPAVPLYIALLYRVMKSKKLHEGCIQQMYRLYHDVLFTGSPPMVDDRGRIRLDDWEMREDVQREVRRLWERVETGSISELGDIEGMKAEFLRHHGFGMPGVDYSRDVAPDLY
ncbi:MAG: trans-2-enoyl-CoA reductase family protein [Desulfobacteraceae bacterium]|nr:trans-2-enoyl-CoA reductase family protein [Desulfobacteraceae bacterium]